MSSFDWDTGYDLSDPKHPDNADANDGLEETLVDVHGRPEFAYRRGKPGWYLIHQSTGTAVFGPFPQQLMVSKVKAGLDEKFGVDRYVLEWVHR